MKKNEIANTEKFFYEDVLQILNSARQKAYSAVNSEMVQTYWLLGKRIVEEEQKGEQKAAYGEALLKNFPLHLRLILGKDFRVPIYVISDSLILLIRKGRFATQCVAN